MRIQIFLIGLLVFSYIPLTANVTTASTHEHNNYHSIEYVGIANQVQIIGEWDWSQPIDLLQENGVWTVNLDLEEGLYCYKFIVNSEYIFDPANPERVFCDGIENSLLRVKDNLRPSFSAELVGDSLIVYYHPGVSGAGLVETPQALQGALWDDSNLLWDYNLSDLDEGKHSLLIEGVDDDGNIAYDLLVPFWTGEHSEFIWDDALIYMIMTDRFVNGNTSNDGPSTDAAQGADWQGGDFAGVTEMINSGYFADIGVNALWLTPFNEAATSTGKASDEVHDVSSFHGYWPKSARDIEPRLGTEDELIQLVETAHDNGIRVMMDFVVNHVHQEHDYFIENPDWFNSGCICGTNACDWTEFRLECQFTSYMPDVNWKNRNASEQFISDALWWIETFNLDGARIDAVKHVDDLAIRNLVAQINKRFETVGTDYYLKGETAMGWSGHSLELNQDQYGTINSYMGDDGLDGQADFVLYHAVVDNVFVNGVEDYQHLDYWTNRSQDQYTPGAIMVPYVGSHDVPRITSRADSGTFDAFNQWLEDGLPGQPGGSDSYNATLQAYGWLLTTPGAPLLYYGDEYGEFGGADPDNRHMYRNSSQWSSLESELFEKISAIGKIRQDSSALKRGVYSTIYSESDSLVYSMKSDFEEMYVVLNRGDSWVFDGVQDSDIVHFGSSEIISNSIIVPKNSVLIIEKIYSNDSNESFFGCTDILATNYNESANEDDDSCVYEEVVETNNTTEENNSQEKIGCMEKVALNYDPQATENDQSCEYKTDSEDELKSISDSNVGIIIRTVLLVGVVIAGIALYSMRKENFK